MVCSVRGFGVSATQLFRHPALPTLHTLFYNTHKVEIVQLETQLASSLLQTTGWNSTNTPLWIHFAIALAQANLQLTFAVIIEPDSLGNIVTNQDIPLCATATNGYEQGIAYAIASLQLPNVAIYIDAAHGGWLGWDPNLPLAAAEFSRVVKLAQEYTDGATIRGWSTNVANYNPYIADPRANYTEFNNAYDETHYTQVLAPLLEFYGLPTNFIIDQSRSGLQNTRTDWGEWCNVEAGFGLLPSTVTSDSNPFVDSIVWVKPGGESDGPCGPEIQGQSAPDAGKWWTLYAMELIMNANPPLDSDLGSLPCFPASC